MRWLRKEPLSREGSQGLFAVVRPFFKSIGFFLFLAIPSLIASAADTFDQYIQSINALEQAQAAKPGTIIRYSDPQEGNLAKAVLDPAHALPMVDFYGELQKQEIRRGDLPNLLLPALSRYEKAFAADPKHFEPEYLDALGVNTALHLQTRRALAAAYKEALEREAARGVPSKVSPSLYQSLETLAVDADKSLAKIIRHDIRQKKYSVEGAQRALKSAEALEGN